MKVLGTGLDGLVGSRIVEFSKNIASWCFELALKNDKIARLGVRMSAFEEGLREIKSQMFHH